MISLKTKLALLETAIADVKEEKKNGKTAFMCISLHCAICDRFKKDYSYSLTEESIRKYCPEFIEEIAKILDDKKLQKKLKLPVMEYSGNEFKRVHSALMDGDCYNERIRILKHIIKNLTPQKRVVKKTK